METNGCSHRGLTPRDGPIANNMNMIKHKDGQKVSKAGTHAQHQKLNEMLRPCSIRYDLGDEF